MDLIRKMRNVCLVVTDENLLRGIDFRFSTDDDMIASENDGIDLLLARPFSNHRAFD